MSGRFAFAVAVLAATTLTAQSPAPAVETRHLSLKTSSTPATAGSGARIVLNVDVVLKPKMHVYAPDQPKDQDYLPITLTLTAAASYKVEKPQYPPSERLFFAALSETQHVYSKPFRITLPIRILRRTPPLLNIEGTVRYQACDDTICYVPQTVPVKWSVQINR